MKHLLNNKNWGQRLQRDDDFNVLHISLAAPETIRSWSWGEVKKPETINYRTFKPERDGLFCARIFGPTKDFECLCGKYKRLKHRGTVCEKCGVEVTQTKVRRERMGHIKLQSPVAHIWFLKSLPSRISHLLDMAFRDVERVLYFDAYIVIDPGFTDLAERQLLLDADYEEARRAHGNAFVAKMGAEAIQELLQQLDLEREAGLIKEELGTTGSKARVAKLLKRLSLIEQFIQSDNKPEWMILNVLPVLPPDLRPLVPLDGDRFATSDLNELYRRVINRNNRLKRLIEIEAPDIIIRNEKRMLQEAVDSLLDNSRRGRPVTANNKRPLKSLADMIKGKQGRFRQNLLGKRVDYSGRSVIVAGPKLKLHQCGLPKRMALELFKPMIIGQLCAKDASVLTIKSAKKVIEQEKPEVWDILADVIREHPVLLNRAPTLHRLGVQAFEPVLIEGKAMQLHPLVCTAYNADFDGDQMAVHVPLTIEAQLESRVLMMSTNNILSPANGEPIIMPSKDMVLGLYWMTGEEWSAQDKEVRVFANAKEVNRTHAMRQIGLREKIKARITEMVVDQDGNFKPKRSIVETTVGRVLLYEAVPDGLEFALVNKMMKKNDISYLLNRSYHEAGPKRTVIFADQLMYMGFEYATQSGVSIGIEDLKIPEKKADIIAAATAHVNRFEKEQREGLLTANEKYARVIDVWSRATEDIAKEVVHDLSITTRVDEAGKTVSLPSYNSVYICSDSGARGSLLQMRQLVGMRGLMTRPDGVLIETPITASFREGLSVNQYFISTHGARKGLTDTALKTANSGYLTRRIVDVAQDLVVVEEDCGTDEGLLMEDLIEGTEVVESLDQRVLGRIVAQDVVDEEGKVLLPRDTMMNEAQVLQMQDQNIEAISVRSPVTCKTHRGICRLCYGRDLARGRLISTGEAAGVVAAQSIGEPGTQLTMRTFHVGGASGRAASTSDIYTKRAGIVRLKGESGDVLRLIDQGDGIAVNLTHSAIVTVEKVDTGKTIERYKNLLPYGAKLFIKDGDQVEAKARVAQWDPHSRPIIAEQAGQLKFLNFEEGVSVDSQEDPLTGLPRIVIKETKGSSQSSEQLDQPAFEIIAKDGTVVQTQKLSTGAVLALNDNAEVKAGATIAQISESDQKSLDITGGLPRISDLLEARTPKNPAILARQTGTIAFDGEVRSKRRLRIMPSEAQNGEDGSEAEPTEVLVPKDRQLRIDDGDMVKKGEVLVEGALILQDILQLRGVTALAEHLIQAVQEVYRLQGITINDKHIEVIIRQMLRKAIIHESGDSRFVPGEQREYAEVLRVAEKLMAEGKKPPTFDRQVLGITKAALATESFISAASFQETTRVLTEAAIVGKTDHLLGLKENVVVGRLIPAGTGFSHHHKRRKLQESTISDAEAMEIFLYEGLRDAETASDTETVAELDETYAQNDGNEPTLGVTAFELADSISADPGNADAISDAGGDAGGDDAGDGASNVDVNKEENPD